MKIIDLLNKIANGEEVPEIILFNSYKYRFDKIDRVYRNIRGNSTLGKVNELDLYLNDEVEIIEEEKKIPEKFKVHSLGDTDENGNFFSSPFPTDEEFMNKINDIIDYLQYIKSKGDE